MATARPDTVAGFWEPVEDFWTDSGGIFNVRIVASCDELEAKIDVLLLA